MKDLLLYFSTKKFICFIALLIAVVPLYAQVYDGEYLEYRRRTTATEEVVINDTLTYIIATGPYRINIENLANSLFYQPNSELNGAAIIPDKEYDVGIFSWDGFELAVEESFSAKERYELGKGSEELIVKYIFSGSSGELLEVAFRCKKGYIFSSLPLEKIALFEQNLKKYWRMKFTKPTEYRMKYISDACIYFFPKVLYVENGPQIKEEGLEEFVPIE